MGSLFGGGGSSKGGGTLGSGLSGFDINAIQQALGFGTEMISNRYHQLGLGVPDPNVFGGDPATAAASGGSLQFGSPGTAEKKDVSGLGDIANAALGQLQTTNISNPAIPGTAANVIAQNQQAAQQNNQLSQLAGQAAAGQGAAAAGGTDALAAGVG
jgi:hypothetical protein